MKSQVSERGQITIDRKARKQLGVRPGMVAYQRVVDGHLEVTFLPALHHRSLYGIFHDASSRPGPISGRELEEAVMMAEAERHTLVEADHG